MVIGNIDKTIDYITVLSSFTSLIIEFFNVLIFCHGNILFYKSQKASVKVDFYQK